MLKRIVSLGTIFTLLGSVFVFSGAACGTPAPTGPITIKYWRSSETKDQLDSVLTAFADKYTGYQVDYKVIPAADYESALLNAMAEGNGPDVFSIPNNKAANYIAKAAPAPTDIFSVDKFKSNYYDICAQEAIAKDANGTDQVYGMPFNMDTLALIYNTKMLNDASVDQPGSTWDQFSVDAFKLTKKTGNTITQAGTALGLYNNVAHASDILQLIMLQNGTEMLSPDNQSAYFAQSKTISGRPYYPGTQALNFYTSFARPNTQITINDQTIQPYSWNKDLANSVDAFARKKVAMIFGYASDANELKRIARTVSFGVAPVPQVAPTTEKFEVNATIARYQIEMVNKASKNIRASWRLLELISQKSQQEKILANTNLLSAFKTQSDVTSGFGVFTSQANSAKTWYKKDADYIDGVFKTAIEAVSLFNEDPQAAINEAASSVDKLLRRGY